jgi:hypothetical protein
MSGIDLAINSTKLYPHLRVIVASGYDLVLSREQQAMLPGVAALRKPYDLADLKRMLESSSP